MMKAVDMETLINESCYGDNLNVIVCTRDCQTATTGVISDNIVDNLTVSFQWI